MKSQDTTLPHPLDAIPEGDYAAWLQHPCTVAARQALQDSAHINKELLCEEAKKGDPDMAVVRAFGGHLEACEALDFYMFGRNRRA